MAAARPWAVLVAATAHLAVLAWLVVQLDADRSGAVATGSGGIQVSLGPAGSSAGAATPTDLPELRQVQEVREVQTETARPVETTETVATVTATPPAATATQPRQPTVATATAPPLITATAAAETQASSTPPTTTARAAPTTRPRPPRPVSQPVVAAAAPAGTAAGRTGSEQAPGAGSGDASTGGGQEGVNQDYLSRLAAWLEQHKAYPRRAQQRGEEGTVLLRFAIDRDGRVLDWRIVRGSGHDALDQEVAAMIRRAEPLPPMPPEMPQPRIELTVPVQFRLS